MTPAIELVGMDKKFGAVHANKAIDLAVAKGSIHGIVGENGAGKSTLMSILYGFYQADSGDIRVNGETRAIRSSAENSRFFEALTPTATTTSSKSEAARPMMSM